MITKITSTSVRSDANTPWYAGTSQAAESIEFQNVVKITEQLIAEQVISVEVLSPDSFTRINITTIHDMPAYLAAFGVNELPAINLPEIFNYNSLNNITVEVITEEIP